MYIVAINGSSKKEGNTSFLLNKGLEQVRLMGGKTDIIHTSEVLKSMPVPFCTVCSSPCQGICAKGTLLEDALNMLRKADGLLIGSPVYFGSVTGQLKAFWDKTRCLRGEKKLLNTVGGVVTVGASRFGGQEGTLKTIQDMMLVQGMTIVGGGQKEYDCGHYGVAAQRPAVEDKNAQERIMIMAKRVYEVSQATKDLRL
ncbi:MAG: flavodoxin family protein [Clostridia bacterium]|nr:flavodoxin family protein [Clostridia bacterium]MDD4047657.1 flavodoxin family protein [Clostridia bacterium]